MRVHPILSWTYGGTWDLIRRFHLPYCCLYDSGYTSLGTQSNTLPNAMLKRTDGTYRPAYELRCWDGERLGRRQLTTKATAAATDATETVAQCRTAGIVVVGDELLKGEVVDQNALLACRLLRQRGIQVRRVAVVRDNHAEIVEELQLHKRLCDIVITSGGVGPTHDDLTVRAVAAAIGEQLVANATMVRIMQRIFGTDTLQEHQLQMSLLPETVHLHEQQQPRQGATKPGWPIVQCKNIFVLPGVPEFFKHKVEVICTQLLPERKLFCERIELQIDELAIAALLKELVAEFPDVTIGSYPTFREGICTKTTLLLEAQAKDLVDRAATHLRNHVQQQQQQH